MSQPAKTVRFIRSGRGKAQCEPDPAYPHGIALNATMPAELSCLVVLEYPAPECGMWEITCDHCRQRVMITAAGRPDDPTSARIPCQLPGRAEPSLN